MSVSNTNLFKKAVTLEISPKFSAFTGVRILTGLQDEDGNDIVYEAGNDTGRVLEFTNEWGTQAQANDVLAKIQGKEYKPFIADGAILDPAAELNDGVTVNGVYSGICTKTTRFGPLMAADISAPYDEEIDHEYSYETPQERKYTRELRETKSELKIQASQISAKVSSSGGSSGANSFGWVLTDSDWSLYSNGDNIFKVDRNELAFSANGSELLRCNKTEGLWINGNGSFVGTLQTFDNSNPRREIFKVDGNGLSVSANGSTYLTVTPSDGLWINGKGTFNGGGTFKGTLKADYFQTGDGQTLATSSQLEAIRASSAASWGSGNSGFVGALNNGINFANMAQKGTGGSYTAEWIVANHIVCYRDADRQTISGMHYGAWLDDNDEYHGVSWKYKTVATDVSGDAWATSMAWAVDSYGNDVYVITGVNGSAWVSTDVTLNYLGY